ncbi:MAG: OstA-like protein [Saprospiraceae bacterium]
MIKNLGAFLVLFLIPLCGLFAQDSIPAADTSSKRIIVDFSDLFEYIIEGENTYQKLIGSVELRQDSVFMYCDSAIIKNETELTAMGNVVIQQGDSLNVYSDSATYSSLTKLADLYGEVVLLNGNQKLFTDSLKYDLNTKTAVYKGGATLTNDTTQLTSLEGIYLVDSNDIFFKDKVVVVNPDFSLKADTLKYNTKSRIVNFLGPTLISTLRDGKIFCEEGFYNIPEKRARFAKNAQYKKESRIASADVIDYDAETGEYVLSGDAYFEDEDKIATADTIKHNESVETTELIGNADFKNDKQHIVAAKIFYNGKSDTYKTTGRSVVSDPPSILEADALDFDNLTGLGFANGNVVWRDTTQDLILKADKAEYDKKRDYLKTKGSRPLLISIVEGDSLFLRADTLISQRRDTSLETQDSSKIMLAYNNVRIYKTDLQAVCDSLVYSMGDSLFYFYNEPIVWSDTSQFVADSISMKMGEGQIDKIYLRQNSFIINSPDEIFFNQIKGKFITASFEEKELRRMLVEGNAESVYYALDDSDAYMGVNKTICSEMLLYFGNNQVEKIKFFAQPKAKLTPMSKANHQELKMPGFRWVTDIRPKSKDDL